MTSKHGEILSKCRQMINFGFSKDLAIMQGGNAKCSEFHAAVGLAVLDAIEEKRAKRRALATYYNALLEGTEGLTTREVNEGCGYQVYPILFSCSTARDCVSSRLKGMGIGTRVYYIPLHHNPFFKSLHVRPLPISDLLFSCIICLPFFESLTHENMNLVISAVKG